MVRQREAASKPEADPAKERKSEFARPEFG
jgi:hypothetical protein